jgi:excinuclease ABC subunit C
VPGSPDPARIPRDSQALFLLQQVRDEAHRFAITFHRERRGKAMTRSVLDGIPGLGATRKTRLLKEIGSVKKLRQASLDDLRALSWLPDPVAEAVHERLHGPQLARAATRPAEAGEP